MSERINVWPYETKKGTRYVFEVRNGARLETGTKIQRRGFLSHSQALKQGKIARLALDNQRVCSLQPMSIAHLAIDYLESLRGAVRAHTAANYKDLLDRYFLPEFGSMKVAYLSEPQITSLLLTLRENGMKPGSVNTVRGRIIGLLEYAVRRGLIASNPGKMTRKQRISSPEDTAVQPPLSLEEARQLMKAATNSELNLFIALCLGLGLRKGEALGLKWSDVDLDKGTILVQRSRGQQRYVNASGRISSTECDGELKTNASRRLLSLNAVVVQALFSQLETSGQKSEGYLVTRLNGEPFPISRLTRHYRELCKSAQVRRVRIHDLRHTSATLALEGAAPIEAVSQALGHSGIDITKRIYAPVVVHLNQVFAQTLGDALGKRIDASELHNGAAHVS